MSSREERNKFLAGYVADEWNEVGMKPNTIHYSIHNPDYHTAEGRQRLLEWAVKKEWWRGFAYIKAVNYSWYHFRDDLVDLLIPESALAEAIYTYLKEKKG